MRGYYLVKTIGRKELIYSWTQLYDHVIEGKAPCASIWNIAKIQFKENLRSCGLAHTCNTSSMLLMHKNLLDYFLLLFFFIKKSSEYKCAIFIINVRLMPRKLQNVIKSKSVSCLMFNKLIKNDQVIFSSEGQSSEVTDKEKLNIHSIVVLEGTCQAWWNCN